MPNNYWSQRIVKQSDSLYDKTLAQTQQQMAVYYKQSLKDVQDDIGALWDKLIEESVTGEIKPNDLYRYNRYYELQGQLHDKLISLGQKEIVLNEDKYKTMYELVHKVVTDGIPSEYVKQSFIILPDNRVEQVLKSIWCADGKNWSTRIWDNKTLLQQRIEKGLLDSVARGISKDKMVAQLQADFGVGFTMADRIARTELTYIGNQATADSYKQAGIERYKFISAHDERTCDICNSLNGKIFYFSEMQVGVNIAPMHANDRCAIVAVTE